LFLLDSGGQYLNGTTDITRTVALGPPTDAQRRHFTAVLKGHIALAMARFPQGVAGYQLDVLARTALWAQGLNFGHGTGHGVGFFLNVHEGPQSIRHGHSERSQIALEPGMLTSNEPGFYQEGAYGIRIENLILCVEVDQTTYGTFLGFETLSLFPIDLGLVAGNLLSADERNWLNSYHAQVFESLSPLLEPAEKAWLAGKCVQV
jgi:Xaa-Pro aminopeptidase